MLCALAGLLLLAQPSLELCRVTAGADGGVPAWAKLAPGIEACAFVLEAEPALGDGRLQVVRVDPARAQLELALAGQHGGKARTAGEWADAQRFVVTINAGMYEKDFLTNVGYLRNAAAVNQKGWKSTYQSVLLLGATDAGAPAALVDREWPELKAQLPRYGSVVQNLRLIKGPPASSVWQPNGKKWSEALVAQDAQGRLLFAFSRTPYEMAQLSAMLLALPLGVVRAMHAEGGPEASLSVRTATLSLDFAGSFETSFFTDDTNQHQWRIPNVIGAR